MPVCAVEWRNGYGELPHWQVSVPGLGSDEINFTASRGEYPTVHFEKIGYRWHPTKTDLPAEYYAKVA
jgi:hypothetical protein